LPTAASTTPPPPDFIIAATAELAGFTILHADKDFTLRDRTGGDA
jgi:predicted nucleic acid-binding protein